MRGATLNADVAWCYLFPPSSISVNICIRQLVANEYYTVYIEDRCYKVLISFKSEYHSRSRTELQTNSNTGRARLSCVGKLKIL